jgi:hypothetical protein
MLSKREMRIVKRKRKRYRDKVRKGQKGGKDSQRE